VRITSVRPEAIRNSSAAWRSTLMTFDSVRNASLASASAAQMAITTTSR